MPILSRGLVVLLCLVLPAQSLLAAEVQDPGAFKASAPSAAPLPALPSLPELSTPITPAALPALPALHLGTEALVRQNAAHIRAIQARARAQRNLEAATAQARKASAGLDRAGGDDASTSARGQFDALTLESEISGAAAPETAADPALSADSDRLAAVQPQKPRPPAQPPTPGKSRWWQVFQKDSARRQSFWRYFTGFSLFTLVYEMYLVSFPYLISSITTNSLRQHNSPLLNNSQALAALIRRNRAEGRIFHWTGQGISYATLPLFATHGSQNPQPWLSRANLIRAGAYFGVAAAAFFITGHAPLGVAMALVSVALGAASFFQGVSSTMETEGDANLMGGESVSDNDRTKANMLLNVSASVMAIIGPALAGHLALNIKNLFGQHDVSSYVIYGIYGVGTALTALIYMTVKLFKQKPADAAKLATGPAARQPLSLKGGLGEIWSSLRKGLKLTWANKFLRVSLLMTLVNSLFSDAFISNILPDYIGTLTKGLPNLGALLHIPVVGWLLQGLTSTPLGHFSFMIVSANVGGMIALALLDPARKLLARLGYRSEESILAPLVMVAAAEAPLFWLMLYWHSLPAALALYGLQSLVTGFYGVIVAGLTQKALGRYGKLDMISVLASQSFVAIIAAIMSTTAYGFFLNNIATGTAMIMAAVAIAVQDTIRLALPWLSFTKEQRKRQPAPPPAS